MKQGRNALLGKRRSDQHKGTWEQGWGVLEGLGVPDRAAAASPHIPAHPQLGASRLPGPARRCVPLPGEGLHRLLFLQEPMDADKFPLAWDSPTFTHHMAQAASPLAQYLGAQHSCCGIIILQSLTALPPYPSPSQK